MITRKTMKRKAKKKATKKVLARKAGDSKRQPGKKARGPGRPFEPGKSGNPAGLSKARREVIDGIRAMLGEGKNWKLACRTLIGLLKHKDGKVQIAALREYFDRVVGKAPQEITGANGEPLVPPHRTPEKADLNQKELDELRRILGSTGAA